LAEIDGGIVDGQIPGLGQQVRYIAGIATLEAVEEMVIEVGGETFAGSISLSMFDNVLQVD
jgi:hypothetical protein